MKDRKRSTRYYIKEGKRSTCYVKDGKRSTCCNMKDGKRSICYMKDGKRSMCYVKDGKRSTRCYMKRREKEFFSRRTLMNRSSGWECALPAG
jgi:hypothetical protein